MGAVERLRALGAGPEILGGPATREADGLRASPMNADLSPDERAAAPALFRALLAGHLLHELGERKPGKILKAVRLALETEPRLAVEALDLVDATTLRPVEKISGPVVLLAGVWVGKTFSSTASGFTPADTASQIVFRLISLEFSILIPSTTASESPWSAPDAFAGRGILCPLDRDRRRRDPFPSPGATAGTRPVPPFPISPHGTFSPVPGGRRSMVSVVCDFHPTVSG